MFSQKQCCKPTQNAPDTGKEKYYSPVLKIKSLIRYPENGAGSALLLLPGHPGCHCFGDEDTDVALGMAVRVPRDALCLAAVCPGSCRESEGREGCTGILDPPSAETELQLSLAEVAISRELPGLLLRRRSAGSNSW